MGKSEIIKTMVESMAERNNTIDLDAYAKGCEDMFDYLNLKRIEFNESQDKISNIRSKEDRNYSQSQKGGYMSESGNEQALGSQLHPTNPGNPFQFDTLCEGDWFVGTATDYDNVLAIENNPMYETSGYVWVKDMLINGGCVFDGNDILINAKELKKTQLAPEEFLRRAENTFKTK